MRGNLLNEKLFRLAISAWPRILAIYFYLMDALAIMIISAASCLSFFGKVVGMHITISSTYCMKNTKYLASLN
jgi:hypothetical protein